MEAELDLSFITKIHTKFNGWVYIKDIVSDDDSTLRGHCQNKRNGGKLDDTIPESRFLADPSHRIKCTVNLYSNFFHSPKPKIHHAVSP